MTKLFDPFPVAGLRLKNRFIVAPMCQYSARHGLPNEWHLVHLGRFALGGFSLVITEATAVSPQGRISYADTGIWTDEQAKAWRPIVEFLQANGAAAGIQLAHAGRKASSPVPWRGKFDETQQEKRALAFQQWQPEAPSAEPHADGFPEPRELGAEEMKQVLEDFAAATRRANAAGFDVVEIHAAHGYLLNQFLSPLANHRTDAYGGSLENRMRFPLDVIRAVRAAWPSEKPLFLRVSATDSHPDGLTPADVAVFAMAAKEAGVDVVHCSSGGFAGARFAPARNYQVPLAAEIRKLAEVPTVAVGLITTAEDAAAIVDNNQADLVALARPALDDPNFPLHAKRTLGLNKGDYSAWPKQEGYAIRNMDRALNPA
ncbi:MAG TPA: NADH:flavin oxidoreductase/NADH oxidase [Tianweitania sediminis]|nr:NADH:flavin oxidoreductase/NADH oxidase [Tianweitania sediminis]